MGPRSTRSQMSARRRTWRARTSGIARSPTTNAGPIYHVGNCWVTFPVSTYARNLGWMICDSQKGQ
jgi:hypothetical protein